MGNDAYQRDAYFHKLHLFISMPVTSGSGQHSFSTSVSIEDHGNNLQHNTNMAFDASASC